jgi:hypothetical protein
VTFCPNVTKGPFFRKIRPFLLTFMCDNWSLKGHVWTYCIKHSSAETWSSPNVI